jgi:putative chitinase
MSNGFDFEFTLDQLKQMVPGNPYIDHWHQAFCEILPDYDINTKSRVAAFVAQCAHESGGFKAIKENLNYRPASLRKLFGKYFPTDALAEQYCAKPDKQAAIANRIYANRMGNGPEESGDGYRYCGRGLIQLTGKDNYTRYAQSLEISVEEASVHLTTFEGCVQSAAWFWEANNLNQWADKGDILTLTKRINGGTIGLDDRIKHYNHALHVLGA